MKRFILLALNLVLVPYMAVAGDRTLSKEAVIQVALSRNPAFKAAQARWFAMKQRVPQVRAWDDPVAGIELQRKGTLNPGNVTDTQWVLSQTIPVSGKNRSRARVSEAEARAAFEDWRRARLDVVMRGAVAYYRLAAAYGQLVINGRDEELLKQAAEISRKKYEVGTGSQADVLMAETELARIAETKADIERDISDQQTQLNVLMNQPANRPVGQPEALSFEPSPLASHKAEELVANMRPEVLRAWRGIEAGEARLQLAKRQWIPDPALEIKAREYPGRSGIQEYDSGIIFSIPWTNFKKYSAGVAEAKAGVESAKAEYESARTVAAGLVRDQFKKIETFAANYRLFSKQIEPTARMTVESMRGGYETDKNSFLELMTAERTLQNVESATLNLLLEHQVACAELEAIVGGSR